MAKTMAGMFDLGDIPVADAPTIAELQLPEPRLAPPASLASQCTTDPAERAGHTYGKSFRDVVRAFRREFAHPPDVVATPYLQKPTSPTFRLRAPRPARRAIPHGGGSSVVGGLSAMSAMRTLAARHRRPAPPRSGARHRSSLAGGGIQAGVYGPALEDQPRPHGLTLRVTSRSRSSSIAWRVDRDLIRWPLRDALYAHRRLRGVTGVVTPPGRRRVAAAAGFGAGPSPDRFFLGSEGILGVITEA
jgi:alkyldihydroxyacetonephosphate synthase